MFDTKKFVLVTNNLFLDFVNTMVHRDDKPFDLMENFKDFLGWAIAVDLIQENKAKQLLTEKNAKNHFIEVKTFRDKLREIAKTIVEGKKIKKSQVKDINEKLKLQNGWAEIQIDEKGFKKTSRIEFTDSIKILSVIAESVADFLTENKFGTLRVCESEDCILFFNDTTKNHSRRWCSMESCGNRAKANAFYKRKKAKVDN